MNLWESTFSMGASGSRSTQRSRRRLYAGGWASLVMAGLLAASPALPCSCITPSLEEAHAAAAAIFVGKVMRVEVAEEKEFFDEFRIAVRTVEVVKGEVAETAELFADNACCGSCYGNPFETGKTYLIFGSALGDAYTSGACSRTAEIALAVDDLKALGLDPASLAR